MKARLKHRVEYAALRGFSFLFGLLPARAAYAAGGGIATVLRLALSGRIEIAEQRIRDVLGPEPEDREIRRIAHAAWQNLVFNVIDLMRSPRLDLYRLSRMVDTLPAQPFIDRAEKRQGGIIAVGHYGNWDLAGIGLSLLGVPIFSMMRRQRNPLIDAYLNRIRTQFGMGVVERNSRALAGIIRRLKKGEVLAILPDLRAKDPDTALRVRFLGKEAWIAGGMALFARHANVPIYPAFAIRTGWNRHVWHVGEPVVPDPALSKEEDILRMTQAVLDQLSRAVLEHPEHYFWFNKRWVLEPYPPPESPPAT